MISDTEKLALVRASKNLTALELIEATCMACKATFINSDIARAEREACAKVCETRLGPTATDFYGNVYAQAIRARAQADGGEA